MSMIILRNKQFSNKEKLNRLGRKTDEDIREAVEGTKAEKEVNRILNKSAEEMKEAARYYSKQDREVVPDDIAEKAKKEGVIQKDKDGYWRIISLKTKTNKSGKAEYWPQKSQNRKDMEDLLKAYQSNKHK